MVHFGREGTVQPVVTENKRIHGRIGGITRGRGTSRPNTFPSTAIYGARAGNHVGANHPVIPLVCFGGHPGAVIADAGKPVLISIERRKVGFIRFEAGVCMVFTSNSVPVANTFVSAPPWHARRQIPCNIPFVTIGCIVQRVEC